MKKLRRTILFLVLVFFLSSIAGGIVFLLSNDFLTYTNGNLKTIEINDVYSSDLSLIDKIVIQSISTDVEIILTNDSNASFELIGYYSEGRYSESPKLDVFEDSGKLELKIFYPQTKLTLGMARNSMNLKIYLPSSYVGDLNLYSVSGDVLANNLELRNIDFRTTSGDLKINNVLSEKFSIETTSGDIKLINSKVNSIETVSGNIEIEDFFIDETLSIKTVSGEIEIDYEEGSSFFVEYKTISGDFEKDFEEFVGNGENKVFVKTTSGDLNIFNN